MATDNPNPVLSALEKALLGIITAAPATTPLFVHSDRGMLIANASEVLLASILAQFNKPKAP